jgi:hypothetical protein
MLADVVCVGLTVGALYAAGQLAATIIAQIEKRGVGRTR